MSLDTGLQKGRAALLALMLPCVGHAQGVVPAGPLGKPAGSFVISAGGTNEFGSGWGTGTLTFQGRTFRFRVDGLLPVKKSDSTDLAEGTVYNLYAVNDFSGAYATIQVSSQTGSQYLQNEHYVVIHITKSKKGVVFRTMVKPLHVDLTD